MKKIPSRFGRFDVQLFILAVALLLFNWPVLTIALSRGLLALYGYLFGGWIVIIVLLFVLAHRVDATATPDRAKTEVDDV